MLVFPFDILIERPPQQNFKFGSDHIIAFSSRLKPLCLNCNISVLTIHFFIPLALGPVEAMVFSLYSFGR
jgi:hypothetical protein